MIVQLEIKSFPKAKRVMYFDDIMLINIAFNLKSLGLTENDLISISESKQVYNNKQVTIKYVTKKQGMRVCVYDGKTVNNNDMIKWIDI